MILLLLLLAALPAHAAFIVNGDNTAGNTTFTFKIGPTFYDVATQQFYVGAAQAVAGNSYALAYSTLGANFIPQTPATVTVNGAANSPNPVNGQQVTLLTVANDSSSLLPALVTANSPAQIAAVPDPRNTFTTPNLNDANGAVSAGIVGLTGGITTPGYAGHYLIAAVSPNGGTFGASGSGLALVLSNGRTLITFNATTGQPGNQALPFDTTTSALAIGAPLVSMGSQPAMTFDNDLECFFITVTTQASAAGGAGQRGVVVGQIINNVITLTPIAPDAAFVGTTHKIVGGGAGTSSTIYAVQTLRTSTRLPYLVVAGGTGDTTNMVYAVPLTANGTLAVYSSTPVDKFRVDYPHQFIKRAYPAAAQTPDDLLNDTDAAAVVGAGPLPIPSSATVTRLIALNDAVYASIENDYNGGTTPLTQPGLFYSQAIFDSLGRIAGWSAWARISGSAVPLQDFAVDPKQNRFWLVPYSSGISGSQTVQLTTWGTDAGDGLLGGPSNAPQNGLTSQITQQLPASQGVVQSMFSFVNTTSGFGNSPSVANNQIGVLAYLSRNIVMLVQSGTNAIAGEFKPVFGDFATGQQFFTDGTLTGFTNGSNMLVMSGGVLNNIGPLTSCEVSRAPLTGGTNGFFFVGGSGGLAVLSNANGSGWNTASNAGLRGGFEGLQNTMRWRTLGNYQNVRKLVADGTYLYVLTNTTLDRITIASIAAGGILSVSSLATVSALNLPSSASFSDVGVSGKLALLATSAGLFRVGNGADVTTAGTITPDSLLWTRVPLPENYGPATRLQFITPTNIEADFTQGSLAYVLCGVTAYNQARIYRLAISEAITSPITDTTVQNLNDLFIQGVPSYLIEYGSYRNFVQSDSVALYNTRSGNEIDTGAQLLNFMLYNMANFYGAQLNVPIVQLPFTVGGTVRRPVRNDSAGVWMLAGDAGLIVNE